MKFKMSMIAAAMAMGFSGMASASVGLGSTGNGELLLSVWDNTTQVSYTRGLGVDMNTFLSNAGVTLGTTAAGSAFAGDTAANNFSLAADANLTSFLSGVAAGDSLEWNVVAYDTTGTNNFNSVKYLMTSTQPLATFTTSGPSNANTINMKGGDANYVGSVNTLIGGTAMDQGSAIATSANGLAYANGGNGFGDNMGNKVPFTNTGTALGQSLNFFLLTPSSSSTVAKAFAYQFGDAAGVSSWTLGQNGALSYSVAAIAAVPEPGEWALMLSGFGLIGFIASRRRKLSGNGMSFA